MEVKDVLTEKKIVEKNISRIIEDLERRTGLKANVNITHEQKERSGDDKLIESIKTEITLSFD